MRATTNCVLAISMHDHVLNTAVINYVLSGQMKRGAAIQQRNKYAPGQVTKLNTSPATTSVESISMQMLITPRAHARRG